MLATVVVDPWAAGAVVVIRGAITPYPTVKSAVIQASCSGR